MRSINWDMVGPALGQVLFNITVTALILSVFGAFIMKYFVQKVPLLSHGIIFFWALFRVLLVAVVLTFVRVIFDLSWGLLEGVAALAGMCAVGWLITRDLAKRA